jgi:hypothetical protein
VATGLGKNLDINVKSELESTPPERSNPMGTKKALIYPINTGWCKADLGTYIFFKGPGGEKIEIPVVCFLVDTGDHKIMVDTGMSSAEWATKYHHDARKGDCLNSPDAVFENLRERGFWWTTAFNDDLAANRLLSDNSDKIEKSFCSKKCGLSVRCVQDY